MRLLCLGLIKAAQTGDNYFYQRASAQVLQSVVARVEQHCFQGGKMRYVLTVSFAAFLITLVSLTSPEAQASSNSTIRLNPGQQLRVQANGCILKLVKNTTSLIRIKCVAKSKAQSSSDDEADESLAPTAKVVLAVGQKVKVLANQCGLLVTKNKAALIKVKCTPPPTCDSNNPIGFNQSVDGSISPPGNQDCYQFSGAAGQRITAFLKNPNPCCQYFSLRLLDPANSTAAFCNFSAGNCQIDNYTLTVTGTYTLVVDGQDEDAGSYTIILNLLGDSEAIGFNQSLDRALSPMGDQDEFTFAGTAGQQITLFLDNKTSCCQYFSLTLKYQDSTIAVCNFSAGDCTLNVTLPQTGTYTVVVDGQDDDTGAYTLSLS